MTKSDIETDPLYQATTDEERITIRAELRQWARDRQSEKEKGFREGQKIYAQHVLTERQNSFNNYAEFQKIFIRSAFLLNGGALISILTLTGALSSKIDVFRVNYISKFANKLMFGIEFFLAGLIVAAVAACIASFAWLGSANSHLNAGHMSNIMSGLPIFGPEDEKEVTRDFNRNDLIATVASITTIAICSFSIIVFSIGAFKIMKALKFASLMR
ncbi:hypothetical protein AB6806_10990 [Bosea sp. RCC_152_1]|uniref:hypothetical protein n=1 Tax=Bosea sp. RCC_152_1 TaxID=3239228 RepID=UPI0035245D5A